AVPGEAPQDLGYALCHLHWLLRRDQVTAAAKLVLAASDEDLRRQDTDEWWRERRVLARRLIDLGDADTAYRARGRPPTNLLPCRTRRSGSSLRTTTMPERCCS